MHFPLVDQTLLALVNELDRVFNRQNMLVPVIVDVVHHCCERRALARARRPCHRNQAPRRVRDLLEDIAHPEIGHAQDFRRDGPEYAAGAAVMVECINPEAGDAGDLKRKVALKKLLVVLALFIVHDLVDQRMDFLVIESGQVDASDIAIDPNHGGQTRRKVQVGSALLGAECKQFCNVHRFSG
jgi:hypothetical protein